MTEEELLEIEERCEAATEGPWDIHRDVEGNAKCLLALERTGCDEFDEPYNEVCGFPIEKYGYGCAWDSEANADFIAHARTDTPRLLAEVRRLKERLEETGAQAWRAK